MPFVTPDRREMLDNGENPVVPGDYCYRWYKEFKRRWNESPSWTTIAAMYHDVRHEDVSLQEQEAKELAWQVFMGFVGFPYEEEKREENGEI